MPGARVQSAHNTNVSATSLAITPGSNLGSGNLMFLLVYARNNTSSSITGTTGWTKQLSQPIGLGTPAGQSMQFWTAPVQAGDAGTKPTITFSSGGGANWMDMIWGEVSGVDTSSTPISVSSIAAGGSSTTGSAGPTGTSGANEFGLAICQVDGGTVASAATGSGFTDFDQQASALCADVAYKTVNSTTLTATTTIASSDFWGEMAVVLKLASASSPIPPGSGPVIGMNEPFMMDWALAR